MKLKDIAEVKIFLASPPPQIDINKTIEELSSKEWDEYERELFRRMYLVLESDIELASDNHSLKPESSDHAGMIYNPYSDRWSFL